MLLGQVSQTPLALLLQDDENREAMHADTNDG